MQVVHTYIYFWANAVITGRKGVRTDVPVSLRDVAVQAGVSTGTVSSVMNNKSSARISFETQRRVRRTAEDLGYQPNPLAQRLQSRQTTQTIGLMLSNLGNPFYQDIFERIEKAVINAGHQIMLDVNTSRYGKYHELRTLASWLVDGVLMWSEPDTNLAAYLGTRKSEIPVVYLGHLRDDYSDAIAFDLRSAGRQAAEHLVNCGYRRLCYLAAMPEGFPAKDRNHQLAPMSEVCGDAGVELEVIYLDGWLALSEPIFSLTRAIAERPPARRPDALICNNDLMALHAYHGLMSAGLRIPDDIALMGFDDIEHARYLACGRLTTVRMPTDTLCRMAVELLWKRIAGDRETPPQQILIPTELIVGNTT